MRKYGNKMVRDRAKTIVGEMHEYKLWCSGQIEIRMTLVLSWMTFNDVVKVCRKNDRVIIVKIVSRNENLNLISA